MIERSKISPKAILVFGILATTGVSLAAIVSPFQSGLEQQVLIGIGSAMFGAALAFFLVYSFRAEA
mgnify:CR=1 FL=1